MSLSEQLAQIRRDWDSASSCMSVEEAQKQTIAAALAEVYRLAEEGHEETNQPALSVSIFLPGAIDRVRKEIGI